VLWTQQLDDADLVQEAVAHLWNVNPALSFGAVYRQGPQFKLTTTNTRGPASGDDGRIVAANAGAFHVPDVVGIGAALRLSDAWTLTADYDHIRYSNLAENPIDIFGSFGIATPSTAQANAARHLKAEDANEFHLGAEYVFTSKHPVALRVGSWLDPDHTTHFVGSPVTDEDRLAAVQFRKGKDEVHYSVGLGVVFSEKFQVDAAFDGSALVKTASFSGVFRF